MTKVLDDRWQRFIHVNAKTLYKGREGNKTIQIVSSSREGTCGISPKVGEQWLRFAYGEGSELQLSLCTRTKSMNTEAWDYNKSAIDNDIVFLQNKKRSSFTLFFCFSCGCRCYRVLWRVRKRRSHEHKFSKIQANVQGAEQTFLLTLNKPKGWRLQIVCTSESFKALCGVRILNC